MAITEANQTTLNKGSVSIPNNAGGLVTQRKRFQLPATETKYGEEAFGVAMDEMVVVEAASAIIEHALDKDTPANNYQAVVEAIVGNIVTVGVQVVSTGDELGDIDLKDYIFSVTAEGY